MTGTRSTLCALLLLTACAEDFDLPPQIASSKYIDYHTDADASVICLDDLLAREDRFIERTATLLGVDVPADTIDFVWDPNVDRADPWVCPGPLNLGCYRSRENDDLSLVVSRVPSLHHELVHAVETQALGQGGHRTLTEGIADYLGSTNPTLPDPTFSDRFKAMLAEDPNPGDYRLAMQFVGSDR